MKKLNVESLQKSLPRISEMRLSTLKPKGTKSRDKRLHHKLPSATPSVWGNPTGMCVSGNAGVQSSQDNMEEFKRLN